MLRVTALCLALGLVVVAGLGCMKCGQGVSQKIAEKAIENAVEKSTVGKAQIDVGSNVDLSGLPKFLQYPGAVAKSRWSMSSEGGTGAAYSFEVAGPAAPVVSFYKQALASWKNASTMENDEATMLIYGSEDEKQAVTVTVSTDKESANTLLTLLYTKKD